jgi:hypothetical protein
MSERKIRLTLSSTLNHGVGALVDVDFNNENLDVDVDVAVENGVSNLIKEYTVDVAPGVYNLDITYKNDVADDLDNDGNMDVDRNLVIEKIEFANNGVDYLPLIVNSSNTNLEIDKNFNPMGFYESSNPDYDPTQPRSESNHPKLKNPAFDSSLPQTDADGYPGYIYGDNPGTNPLFLYDPLVINPVTMYFAGTATFQIAFS